MQQGLGRLTENGAIFASILDTIKKEVDSKEHLSRRALAVWKTGGVLNMVAATARRVTQELREVEHGERARDVSRMIQDAVSFEVGGRMTA